MILLTIAVPTYNRHRQLAELSNSFLLKVAHNFGSFVEIIIIDNSDDDVSQLNQSLFKGSGITYLKNSNNIGYARNIVRCINHANGNYLWIISDDDYIKYNEFSPFIAWMKQLHKSTACIMLPYENISAFGEKRIKNTKKCWVGNETINSILLSELIANNLFLPFVLFSGVVLKINGVEKKSLLQNIANFLNNDYIQIPLFFDIVGANGVVSFYGHCMVEYKNSKKIRFNIQSMRESYLEVVGYICTNVDGIDKNLILRGDERRWMGWLILDKIKEVNLPGADKYKYKIIADVIKTKNVKNTFLAVLLLTPKWMLRRVYRVVKFIKFHINKR